MVRLDLREIVYYLVLLYRTEPDLVVSVQIHFLSLCSYYSYVNLDTFVCFLGRKFLLKNWLPNSLGLTF